MADMFGYGDAVLFGRARSGVIALLDALEMPFDAPFVMPSNLCPDLLLALRSYGIRIRFAAVEAESGLPSDDTFLDVMRREVRPGVVMPTHLYGFVHDYPQTLVEARARGWFVLENDSLATRARFAGAHGTAFGDALVVSFGYAKTIEAGGGGALFTNDSILARELRLREQRFPPLDEQAIKAEERFMLLSRQLREGQLQATVLSARDKERLLLDQAPSCRYGFPDCLEQPLSSALEALPTTVENKRRRVAMWDHFLTPFNETLPAPRASYVIPWRLIRRAPLLRDKLVLALRNEYIDAGTNFPPLTDSFPVLLGDQRHESAEQWGREVLNLWLTPAYDAERMKRAADVIGRIFSRQGRIGNGQSQRI